MADAMHYFFLFKLQCSKHIMVWMYSTLANLRILRTKQLYEHDVNFRRNIKHRIFLRPGRWYDRISSYAMYLQP